MTSPNDPKKDEIETKYRLLPQQDLAIAQVLGQETETFRLIDEVRQKALGITNPFHLATALVKHNIQLTPILRKKGPTMWQAGYRQLGPDNWGSYIGNTDFTTALTPENAVQDLLAGIRRLSEDL